MSVTLDKTYTGASMDVLGLAYPPLRSSHPQTCKLPGHHEGLRMNDLYTLASALKALAWRGHLPLQVEGSPTIVPIDHEACIVCR